MARANTGVGDEGEGGQIKMAVEVSGPSSVPGDEFMPPHSPVALRP